jgi:hypothetical protein
MSDLKKAEAVAVSIEAKRIVCVRHGTELQDERANVALSAHTGGRSIQGGEGTADSGTDDKELKVLTNWRGHDDVMQIRSSGDWRGD